ncbi:MAG: hypothetical protein WB774_26420, partial [Xanthobacteraceae bacterium]
MKPVRRIVTIDDAEGKSLAIADGLTPDRKNDPARPGFISERIWVTDASPPQIGVYRDAVLLHPQRLEPPRAGSVCRIVTFPPDDVFRGKVGAAEVEAYFRAMGSPAASTFRARGRIPICRRRKRSTSAWCSKARSRSCSTPRKFISRPATRWCNAAPTTPGAIVRTGRAASRSHC